MYEAHQKNVSTNLHLGICDITPSGTWHHQSYAVRANMYLLEHVKIKVLFVQPSIMNYKLASRGFTVCTTYNTLCL